MKEMLLALGAPKAVEPEMEFLGELGESFLTYATLSTALGVTEGMLNTTAQANRWLRFRLDGKELVVSKVAVRSGISYNHLYSKGVVYGTNNTGLYPPTYQYTGGLVNQFKTITVAGKMYKVRLLKGCDPSIDPLPTGTLGYDLPDTQQSEWSRLFYPIIIDDPNAKSYTGPRLASYTEADLQMRYVSSTVTPGAYAWCQEVMTYNVTSSFPLGTYRIRRGYEGPSYCGPTTSSGGGANYGWRPCLELVQ